jgi:anhydro-N-acetylmuramic acid kinase
MKNNFKVIGLMSGTSLDGLDIAFCEFGKNKGKWEYKLVHAVVKKYPKLWINKLGNAANLSSAELISLDAEFGRYLGKVTQGFITDNKLTVDFIASHGHTVFHQPHRGFTYQIGNGNAIHALTGLPVIFDFRTLDVMLGGQGAPLVPAGDKLLFYDIDMCLNLGGIANLSADVGNERKAFDICFCNMSLNHLMGTIDKSYDQRGELSSQGEVNEKLLSELKKLYTGIRKKRPSLGREFFEQRVAPLLGNKKISLKDKLATCVESSAMEISYAAKTMNGKSMLCTGGGTFNSFLISRILHHAGDSFSMIIPDDEVVKFKEALVFAFLGVLRTTGENNCFRSVTGASQDSSAGVMVGF